MGCFFHRLASQVLGLLAVDLILARPQIRLLGLDALAAGDELVPEDETEVERDTKVSGDEAFVVEVAVILAMDEDVVALCEGNDAAEGESEVGACGAQGGLVYEVGIGDVLGFSGAHKVDVGDEQGDPGEETEDGDQIHKVFEDGLGVAGDVHVGKAGEAGGDDEGVDGDAAAVGAGEDGGGFALAREPVDGTSGDVEVRVGGGEDEEEDAAVEDVGEDLDAGQLDGDDEGRGSCGAGFPGREDQALGVVGDQGADEQNADHVEEEDPVEGEFDGARDRLARVLGLADGHADQFGTQVCERGRDHGRPEGIETARGRILDVPVERTGVLPVPEAPAVVIGAAAQHQNEGEQDQTDNDDHFEGGQPELEFTKEPDTKVVDGDYQHQEDGDPHACIDS